MTSSYRDLIARAKAQIREIGSGELESRLGDILLVDVREPAEHARGSLPGAMLIPRGSVTSQLPGIAPEQDREIVVYCAVGDRSALAAAALQDAGYTRVSSLAGGIVGWAASGHPVVAPDSPAADRLARYHRQIVLPQVGEEGQRRLLASRVVIVGAGGLGSPAALYLAAAGVGTLRVVDGDAVEVTNLQRQILHDTRRIGRPKVESVRQRLGDLNPDVTVEAHPVHLTAGNALALLGGADVIVDGTDSFPARYLINDAALHLKIPVVHGAVFRFEGQATTFRPYAGPCYRCLFPAPPSPELAPPCAEAGVLGALPGIIGSIQAAETIKLLLGVGTPLVGHLLSYDVLDQVPQVLRFGRDPDCPACGDERHPPALIDYDETCAPGRNTRS
ncbi:MAG: molybdopterin-synthase adenylyltransferase MoeB [Acidimicrobiia bacterium]|jgi:molybdopterin/thiamine biosynthesis adenylyltransferase/rhodanese-related sulfurtransferase